MAGSDTNRSPAPLLNPWAAAYEYAVDAWQRGVLYADVMRQRGNQYHEHMAKRAPNVLSMESELVLDGRCLPRPVNYGLLRIKPPAGVETDPIKRPFLVVDPRAGHGPGIGGFKDLLKPGVKVMAVSGAGQTGLWEDVAGRLGDIESVRALRANLILPEAGNSAQARKQWTEDQSIDAWLIWNIWQVSNPDLASMVEVEEPYRIYRDAGAVVTRKGKANPQAQAFVDFLEAPEGKAIFRKWGWKTD